jgi:hypothetical protein
VEFLKTRCLIGEVVSLPGNLFPIKEWGKARDFYAKKMLLCALGQPKNRMGRLKPK